MQGWPSLWNLHLHRRSYWKWVASEAEAIQTRWPIRRSRRARDPVCGTMGLDRDLLYSFDNKQ